MAAQQQPYLQSCIPAHTSLAHAPTAGAEAVWSEDNVIAVPGDRAITLLHAADVQCGRMLVPLAPQGPDGNEALVQCLQGRALDRTDIASVALPCRHAALHRCAHQACTKLSTLPWQSGGSIMRHVPSCLADRVPQNVLRDCAAQSKCALPISGPFGSDQVQGEWRRSRRLPGTGVVTCRLCG